MRALRTSLLAVTTFLLSSAAASAGVLTWTITNGPFNVYGDGGMTGSFDYDADTDTYSNIHLSTNATSQSGVPYTIFTEKGDYYFTAYATIPSDLNGVLFAELAFDNPLTNDGGTDAVAVIENVCQDSTCSGHSTVSLGIYGTVEAPTSSAAPEPAAVLLSGGGLAGLIWLRRRLLA